MKRNFITFCTMVLSLVVLSSCSKENIGTQESQLVTFKVSSEATKTYLSDGLTNWNRNDLIYVADETKVYKSDKLESGAVPDATFTFSTGFPETPKYALYVGRTDATAPVINGEQFTTTLPVEQNMNQNNSFCNHANYAIGEVVNNNGTYGAVLKNICGLLKFEVPAGIAKVRIEGNAGEFLAGKICIDYNDGEPAWTVTENQGSSYIEITPRTNDNNEYVAGIIYACVLPQTFERGITVTVTDAEGNTAQRVGSSPLVLGRNKVVDLKKLDMNIGDADKSLTLEFDFSDETIYPEGFPAGTGKAAKFEEAIMLRATNGKQYGFTCSGTVCQASSSSTGQCFVLYEGQQTMTFPQVEGKSLSQVTVYGGNASAKAVYLKDASGTNVSEKGLPSATEAAVMTPKSGKTAVSLYNNSTNTYISKLVLVYE